MRPSRQDDVENLKTGGSSDEIRQGSSDIHEQVHENRLGALKQSNPHTQVKPLQIRYIVAQARLVVSGQEYNRQSCPGSRQTKAATNTGARQTKAATNTEPGQ